MSDTRILLVEDDPDDVHFMKRAFAKVSSTVSLEVAMDGQAAVDCLSSPGHPDYVLLDLKIPKKPGLEVLEWIRATPELAKLRVMLLTSSQSQAEISRANRLGVDAYLIKPVQYGSLLDLVRTICRDWSLETLNGKQGPDP
jgi:DNA-binding response OmpR family regulator